jgi:hypothetical protein
MREARVLRGKGPLIYHGNLRPGHDWARSRTCLASQICPSQKAGHVQFKPPWQFQKKSKTAQKVDNQSILV